MGNSENLYEYIINTASDMITLIGRDYRYKVVNDSYCTGKNLSRGEILNASVAEIWGEEKFNSVIKPYLDRCFAGEEVHYVERFEFGLSWRYVHVSYYPYKMKDNDISHVLVFNHDITKLGEIESRLLNYEFRDLVTGLFNNRSLEIILDMELEKAKRSKTEKNKALLILSVNNYQCISLEQGITIGNMLLENTGIRIKDCLRTTDYVFRFNGSELAVLLTGIKDVEEPVIVAQKILNAVTVPYRNKEDTICMNCSIGIAISPEDGQDYNSLVSSASKALAAALHEGREFRLFDNKVQNKIITRIQMRNELHRAIDQKEFELYYQPIVDERRRICGCETLVRWNHPERGLVGPSEFIPLAEETGIISALSKWILFETSKQISSWSRDYGIYTSVNLAAREYANDDLPAVLEAALAQAGDLSPEYLHLEITESETMKDPDQAIMRMNQLRDRGFQIYMDDFGTGHSSLCYLKNIPADVLKLDKSFIDDLHHEPDSLSFLKMIIHLADNRRKNLIIEGVETEEQLDILIREGCNRFQGFLFSEPLRAGEFEKLLKAPPAH